MEINSTKFDYSSFFENFKNRWLNTNELIAFLSNVKALINNNLVKISFCLPFTEYQTTQSNNSK